MNSKIVDMTGMVFGRLTIKSHVGKIGNSRTHFWLARCECGNEVNVNGATVRCGKVRSCGCLQLESASASGKMAKKHGMSNTTTYYVWRGMISRCTRPDNKDYKWYGGAGITVCERWKTFQNFFDDMGARPDGMSIDRIDRTLGYSPENCRWATLKEQARNQSNNRIVLYKGEYKCVKELSEYSDVAYQTIIARLNRGWSIENALNIPSRKR